MVTFLSSKSPDIALEVDFNTGIMTVWWFFKTEGENIGETKSGDLNLLISQLIKGGWTMA